jgi:tetratricopeptide (TPR) repeat protein
MRAAVAASTDPDVLADLADQALREGEEEQALPLISRSLGQNPTAQLWQWKALLERSLDEHEQALESFAAASRLDPSDAGIAHGRARVALEGGVPAEHLYEQARALAPADGAVLIGLAAARLAAGRGEQAEAELDSALLRSPLWMAGHIQLAQLRSMLGRAEQASASLERALAATPNQPQLWRQLFELWVKSDDFARLDDAVASARRNAVEPQLLRLYEAIAAAELGEAKRADRLFDEVPAGRDDPLAVWRIRHLLRTGRTEQALPLIDRELQGPRAAAVWPYAALAWRLADDARRNWLERGGKLVSVVDLADKLPPLDRLSEVLRSIHKARGEYLDQSLRGGTQTDGPLFSRIEPEIRALRAAVVEAIETYVAQLPDDPGHPLLRHRRERRVRFAGSWSVRLKDQGYHVSHVHPQGWISSALYVALPAAVDSGSNEGWLQLGEPRPELGLGLDPMAHVKPVPGRLVLFPSWMWHGTIPFPAGERLTVAFDVAIPR